MIVIKMGQPRRTRANWGDFYYAYSLKKSLEMLGHRARVAFRDELHEPTACEIVLLGLGMESYQPPRDSLSIAWLISHPDKNDERVLRRYSKAFVASPRLSREWGFPHLAQAYDADVHFAREQDSPYKFAVVFVGNARFGARMDLVHELNAALPEFHVWGSSYPDLRSWRGRLPWMRSGGIYRASKIVVSEHAPASRTAGILNDRLYAAIACRSFVISDRVDGIHDHFPEIMCYSSPEEAVELCLRYVNDDYNRGRIAADCEFRCRRESFDQRAEVLSAALGQSRGVTNGSDTSMGRQRSDLRNS